KFKRQYPDVNLSLALGDTLEIIQRVASGDLQLGVVGAEENVTDLAFVPLLEDELVFIVAPDLVGRNHQCDYNALKKLPWIMREPGSGTRKAFEGSLGRHGGKISDFNVVLTVEGTQAVLSSVKAGVGMSIVSKLAADSLISSGEVVQVVCPELEEIRRHFYCVYHERRHYFPAVRYFMAFLKEECSQEAELAGEDSAAA
ncbi:MAG: LysR substrate-binding domain-containing protein, partial [Oceanidesulfovibrio sp.]